MPRLINGNVLTAFAAGMLGGLLAPLVWPAASRAARPTVKRVMKAGVAAFERTREVAAEWAETASDLVAEVEAERAEELRTSTVKAEPESKRDGVVPINAGHRPEDDRDDRKVHA
jgi:hypothetical protein